MNMIDILCFGGSAGATLFALWMFTRIVFEDGWLVIPNAIAWCIERTYGRRQWKAELEAEGLKCRINQLETWSSQWEVLRAQGVEIMWHDTFGWMAAASVCPCGYLTECAIWCGDGHTKGGWVFATDGTGWQFRKGQCDHDRAYLKVQDPEPYPVIGFVDDRNRPVMWDVKGADGKYER